MNRQHPYGGYDAGPNDRGNRPMPPGNDGGYGSEGPGPGYFPSAPNPPPHHLQPQQQQQMPSQHYPPPPPMNGQNDYQDYREGGQYAPPSHDYRPNPAPGMPPPFAAGRDGRGGGGAALTLGSGPMNNNASQYGGPVRYDGPSGGQSPAPMMHNHHPYGSPSAPQHYTADNAANPTRPIPPPMRQPHHQQQQQGGYDSHVPPKPEGHFQPGPGRPSLGSPPSHLPRAPGREWGDDQPAKRARRDGSFAEEERGSEEVIKERLKRERPCRTLFVRNVEFNANLEDLRQRFEAFGEIKSWFDLTTKRGLLFISYFDLRSAEHAKASMQDFELNGRRLDVHYSLPREVDMTKRCDRDKDQGTLFILLKRAQGELNDEDVRATFAQFGEIKSLRRYKDQGNCRFLEYYDCRACKAAHDSMFGASWNGGTWDMKFAWDAATPDRIAEKPRREREPARPAPPPPRGADQNYAPEYGREAGPPPPMRLQPTPTPPGGPPHWAGGQAYPPQQPPANNPYPPYGPAAGGDFRPPPPGPSPGPRPPPGGSYGQKRPYDYDDRAGPEPPMRRWGQPQGSANPAGSYGQARPEQQPPPQQPGGQNAGYGPGADRMAYGAPPNPEYGRYGGERNEYGGPAQPPSAAAPPPNRWGPGPSGPNSMGGSGGGGGYGPPPAQHGGPPVRPAPMQRPPPQQQPHPPSAPPPADDRLEQAQKVQQLLASLKPGNIGGSPSANRPPMPPSGPAATSPAPAATPAAPASASAPAAPAPALPSNIAALLQMAQSNARK